MLNPFSRKTPVLTESQKIIAAAREAAVNESCCAVDNEINGLPDHARLNRTHVRRLENLADLLEAQRNGHELTPAERIAVRLALDTLRQKLGKK